jgi:hypothetical protein
MKDWRPGFFQQYEKRLEEEIPQMLRGMRVRARSHYLRNFALEAFVDDVPQRWAPRKTTTSRYQSLSRKNGRRNILVKTGAYRGSIRARVFAARHEVRVYSHVRGAGGFNYPRAHNEGWGKLPARRVFGNSRKLNNQVKRHEIAPRFKRVFRK